MKKALIETSTGRLCDIVLPGAEFPVAPGLQWVDAPDDVAHDTHEFNGTTVARRPPLPQAAIDAANNAAAQAALRKIDVESIPFIREYIASRPDAPAGLKALEAQAKAERARLK